MEKCQCGHSEDQHWVSYKPNYDFRSRGSCSIEGCWKCDCEEYKVENNGKFWKASRSI